MLNHLSLPGIPIQCSIGLLSLRSLPTVKFASSLHGAHHNMNYIVKIRTFPIPALRVANQSNLTKCICQAWSSLFYQVQGSVLGISIVLVQLETVAKTVFQALIKIKFLTFKAEKRKELCCQIYLCLRKFMSSLTKLIPFLNFLLFLTCGQFKVSDFPK